MNDRFDRFPATLELRLNADEVAVQLRDVGFNEIVVLDNPGWVASGSRPTALASPSQRSGLGDT
jgi:hypothetical protein